MTPLLPSSLYSQAAAVYLELAYRRETPPRVKALVEGVTQGASVDLNHPSFEVLVLGKPLGFAAAGPALARKPVWQVAGPTVGLVDSVEVPKRWDLRLGWQRFAHVKLSVELTPDRSGWLFGVNTHDQQLLRPPGAPEASEIEKLIADNNDLKQLVERAWALVGVPTFHEYLRCQVNRRLQSVNLRKV